MKYIVILAGIFISLTVVSQNCYTLPRTFTSYEEAIKKIENTRFKLVEFANTTNSSWIKTAKYYSCDGAKGYLIFTTNKGYMYIHSGVPISIWYDFKSAASKGAYYNKNIKKRYRLIIDAY